MDSYTPEEPSVDKNRSSRLGYLVVGALSVAAWRRRRQHDTDDAFPVVFTQETEWNQAICSLMSKVLLRKVENQQCSPRRWCGGNKIRGIRDSVPSRDGRGEDVPLTWHVSGNNGGPDFSTESMISVPMVFFVSSGAVPRSSSFQVVCDQVANHGWVAAVLSLHSNMSSSRISVTR